MPALSAARNRDGASSGKTSASFKSAANGSSRRVTRSMPISTTVASALKPTHQATYSTVDPLGGATSWLATCTKITDATIGATSTKARTSPATHGRPSHRASLSATRTHTHPAISAANGQN